jgi:formate/nitrite transporter
MTNPEIIFDALLPPAMAAKAEEIGVKKANTTWLKLFVLAVLAGAFIAVGAIFSTVLASGSEIISDASGKALYSASLPYGITRLLAGLGFSLGLILVMVGGAELFTGNNLITIAFMSRKVSLAGLLCNWVIVYLGNFAGALATAAIIFVGKHYTFGKGTIGLAMLTTGEAKCSLGFVQAVALGMMCNALVCMAVWLCYSARTTTDKILAIVPPITAFVAAGFEHSVANMYFIQVALLVKNWAGADFFELIHKSAADFPHLTWNNFLVANLLPVTIGNIIGGAVMVGMIYWFVYLRKD